MPKITDRKFRKKIILIVILLLAFILRFWKLDSYPALNADEAAIGYNAFSLIETGKDEHGNPWPIHFESFGDYKPGLYFYLVLPFVKILGLNEWAVRIPGALLGVTTVFLLHVLVRELKFENRRLEILAPALLAISPWHIHFSRGGWEVNVATFLTVLGVYLFLKGFKNLPFLMLSVLSFALSLYTYHATRIVVPLLILVLIAIYWQNFKSYWKRFFVAGLMGLVFILPLIKDFTRPEIFSRAGGVGLFADTGPLARINEQRGEHNNFTGLESKVLHNKAVNYGLAFLKNWSEHYHGLFLFLSGDDIQRNKVPETGQMYIFDVLWLGIGVWWMAKNIKSNQVKLVLLWLLIAPIAAALTFQSPHALRAQNMVIPLTIISGVGLTQVITWVGRLHKLRIRSYGLARKMIPIFSYLLVTFIIIWGFARYEHMYWIHLAKEYPFSSQYGVKELVNYINTKKEDYQKILVTDRYDQPYILFLFYLKYPAQKFQEDHVLSARDNFGFSTVRNFDKFEFRSIVWDTDQPTTPNSLIIGTDEDIPDEANIVKEIYGSNGYKYFQVVAN